jgi:hypothetical protein
VEPGGHASHEIGVLWNSPAVSQSLWSFPVVARICSVARPSLAKLRLSRRCSVAALAVSGSAFIQTHGTVLDALFCDLEAGLSGFQFLVGDDLGNTSKARLIPFCCNLSIASLGPTCRTIVSPRLGLREVSFRNVVVFVPLVRDCGRSSCLRGLEHLYRHLFVFVIGLRLLLSAART